MSNGNFSSFVTRMADREEDLIRRIKAAQESGTEGAVEAVLAAEGLTPTQVEICMMPDSTEESQQKKVAAIERELSGTTSRNVIFVLLSQL